jgi:DNA replication protein DnaD
MKITNDNDFSLQSFLINESLSDNDINNFEYNYHLKRLNIHRDFRESFIVDFYSSFCKAQARLLDLDDDFSFLIFIIEKAIIETAETNDIIFPYIQDILNKVIVNKSISHSKAREEAQKGFINANYMTEFQNVLCNVIKAWEI